MSSALRSIRDNLIMGFLYLVPLAITLLIVREVIGILAKIVKPVAKVAGAESFIGIAGADLLALLALLLIGYLAGMFARTRVGDRIGDALEALILKKVPGYTLLKGAAAGHLGVDVESEIEVCLARIEDAWQFAFVLERPHSGPCTVFLPSAPTPTAGTVMFLEPDRLRRVDLSVGQVMKCVSQLGVGAAKLLQGTQLAAPG
jgi:uncharacterized membrane protein